MVSSRVEAETDVHTERPEAAVGLRVPGHAHFWAKTTQLRPLQALRSGSPVEKTLQTKFR